MDPSLRNWAVVSATLIDNVLKIHTTTIIKTANHPIKSTKQSVSDINAASLLYKSLLPYIKEADVICIEVPHGSQSSRAMASYAICVSLIGALQHTNPNMVYVSANDVKKVVRTDKDHKPTKKEVIQWVRDKHPEAPLPNTLSAEHPCDAIVAIYAAMETKQFKEYINANSTK